MRGDKLKQFLFVLLAVILMTGSAVCQDDNKGRVNLPRAVGSDGDVKGPVQSQWRVGVPNVVGKTLAEAITILDSAEFKVKSTGSGNKIKSQNPAANALVSPGTTVTLTR
jgi:hypothetical protein